MKPRLFILMLLALFGCTSNGQQKKKTQLEPQSGGGAKEVINKITEKRYNNLKPGDIAPDAVHLEVDGINALLNGACVVVKGNKYALIDLNGQIIVPYGKYKIEASGLEGPAYTALLTVTNPVNGKSGCINVNGDVVLPLIYRNLKPFDYNLLADVSAGPNYNDVRIDATGKIAAPLNFQLIDPNETGLRGAYNSRNASIPILYRTKEDKFGYAFKNGKKAFPELFDGASPFSEGLAAVQKTDEYGMIKWGFIDLAGKLVIPYTFQVQPGNFHDGLALTQPVMATNFNYAYIDKSGAVILKVGDGKGNGGYIPADTKGRAGSSSSNVPVTSLQKFGYFFHGYSYWKDRYFETVIMDKTGKYVPLETIEKTPGISAEKLSIVKADDLGVYFNRPQRNGNQSTFGLMDFNGNVIFPPIFNILYPDYYSPYAIASIKLDDTHNRAGIVNRQGVFVVVIADKPTF